MREGTGLFSVVTGEARAWRVSVLAVGHSALSWRLRIAGDRARPAKTRGADRRATSATKGEVLWGVRNVQGKHSSQRT